jgi:ATP-dependent RNA helicase DeaD
MTTFEDLGISPDNIRALVELGFEYPMPVQEKVIPLLLEKKRDIVALAQTGTGKTAAYGLPLIQHTDLAVLQPQAIILCPTRELCIQIAGDMTDFAKYTGNLKILPVYGGSSIETQISALKKGVHIVVATPGRLLDLIRRKTIKTNMVNTIVLDEADEMLNMGFIDSINDILAVVPEGRSTMLFSATMPKEVESIARKYMKDPLEISIGKRNSGAENIKHIYYVVHARDKYLALKRIADYYPSIYGIVFCRTRRETQEIADKLIQDGYNAEALHGDLSQSQRDFVMNKFRIRHIQLLVATDVAARGLDVDDLTHIINYNLPDENDAYTHRSGRTGRAGKTGTSISIINLKEKHLIRQLEQKVNKPFTLVKVPGGREICEKQLFNLIEKMEKVEMENTEIDSYLPVIYRKLEWFDKEDIIKRFVSLEFNRFLDYYKNAVDINASEERHTGRDDERLPYDRDRKTEQGYTRLFINLGKAHGLYPKNLIELINEYTSGKKVPIGKIDLMRNFSFFEVESTYAKGLIEAMANVQYNGARVAIDIAQDKDGNKQDFRKTHASTGSKDFIREKRKSFSDALPNESGNDRRSRSGPRKRNKDRW